MQITVYLDVIFLINFIADFFVLAMTGIVAGKKIIVWKVTIGAVFGAVMLLVFIFHPYLLLGWKGIACSVGISMGTVAVSYGVKNSFVRTWFLSTTIMVLTGGIMNYLKYILQASILQICQWLLLFGVSGVSIFILTSIIQKSIKKSDNIYLIQIQHQGQSVVEMVYMDTGNMLRDPMFQKPVMVLSEKVINKCLSDEEQFIIEQYRKNGTLDYNILLTCQMQKKDCFHEIAYQSVGNLSGKMLCMLVEEVNIMGSGKVLHKQPVAIVPDALFEGKEYQGLLHKDCI